MTKEFNLSDKRISGGNRWLYPQKDVKEFIKRILDYGEKVAMTSEDLMEEIKERAGDKLI